MRTPDRPRPTRATFASLRCSFCGKPRSQVRSLVCGPTPDVAICDECVDLSGEIIREQLTDPTRDDHSTAA